MDYSNDSFERFQKMLGMAAGEASLIWHLRDGLFAAAFYGSKRRIDSMNRLPGGWLLSLGYQALKERNAPRQPSQNTAPNASHFLFLSTRNNHTRRLIPMLEDCLEADKPCMAWSAMPGIRELPPANLRDRFHDIQGMWTRHLTLSDLRRAASLAREVRGILKQELNRRQYAAICQYLVQFLAWRRFWRSTFTNHKPTSVISTFEKAPRVKSFFYAAWEMGVPERIHWIHGLRHASIQATLATELWCMTPGDVRFFKKRVPDACTPIVKDNPEAVELVEHVGVLDLDTIKAGTPLHFLFLGPGLDASYTREMRMSDLAIIRQMQETFGERISWRFRPHPSAKDRFKCELNESGIVVNDFSTRHLHDDLKWAHAVSSSWSSLLLDVRATGRPIFWIQSEIRSLGAVDELIEDGIGVHLDAAVGVERLAKAFPALEQ